MIRKTLRFLAATTIFAAVSTRPAAADPSVPDVLREMKRVADWQIANPSKHPVTDWTQAPFYLGLLELHQVSGDDRYLDALKGFGEACQWGPGPRVTHADDHAVLQAWLGVEQLEGDTAKLTPTIEHFPKVLGALEGKPRASLAGGSFTWCWCDALYMSPPVWAQLSKITGDPKYLEWADREWWTTTDVLYNPTERLFYRDNIYFAKRTETGRKVFWSRGNGWVVGGLIHMLDHLPEDHPNRGKYLGLYQDMMSRLLELQNDDGLWRSSLLDPQHPEGESSGSSFHTYGMAWGINRGLLPAAIYRPAVMKAWKALCGNIQPDGMLGFVQRIAAAPGGAGKESTEVYGSGAFLQAGAEIVRMLDPSKRRKGLASFDGVKLPERYMRAEPRVRARYVPERADDFAWENDWFGFRAYGPALRDGAEDGGFDAWLKRVPWPVMDKWYIEDVTKLPYGRIAKSYHEDHGEGYDAYKVGDSRGCGGISLWVDGKLHNSETYVGHRMIEETPERAVFELDYASKLGGRTVRETKRFTVLLGERLFQCESRFSIDGKSGPLQVAIGLKPQSETPRNSFGEKSGAMALWETLDGLGLGQGIVLDPAAVVKMMDHSDAAGQKQALCIAKTDDKGYIRWFSGFAWEGRGDIKTADAWNAYLGKFAGRVAEKPFADHSETLKVNEDAEIPAGPQAIAPIEDVPGAVRLASNGGWCWYQDPRAIVLKDGRVVFNTISGDTFAGRDAGDLWISEWNPETNTNSHFELHDKFHRDDHDVAALHVRGDGRILAVYGKHGNDKLQRWRISEKPGDISAWTEEKTFDTGAGYTYSNVYQLSAEGGRLYNFSRARGYNPNCTISEDDGLTWKYGWRLLSWSRDDMKGDPRFTGSDGGRPYLRYASNGTDTIHFIATDDHPRAYDNSIYHGFYRNGKLHASDGSVVGEPGRDGNSDLKPRSFTEIFQGGPDAVGWTTDLEVDKDGRPYAAFTVQVDGAGGRGKRQPQFGNDHRFWYGRFDGKQWHCHEIAHAGSKLYQNESDYTGLIALDPDDPDTVVISTDADPVSGEPLVSQTDGKRHRELFRGKTADGGKTWNWTAITKDSALDNLRPNIPSNPGGKRIILWCRGDMTIFTDYRFDIAGLAETR
ncbi:MAG: glycoside hydrolase family 88 protein [Akkermansiaceae bacterium]|nr:glycoside hydrolase family 88 protein [Akkermansiaceae bacterium]